MERGLDWLGAFVGDHSGGKTMVRRWLTMEIGLGTGCGTMGTGLTDWLTGEGTLRGEIET